MKKIKYNLARALLDKEAVRMAEIKRKGKQEVRRQKINVEKNQVIM